MSSNISTALLQLGNESSTTTAIPINSLQPSAFIVLILGSALSVLGCLTIISTYASSKQLQSKLVLRQVFFQSIATLVHALSYMLSFGQVGRNGTSDVYLPNSQFYCDFQGVLLTASALAGFVYNFYIAFDLLSFFGYTPQVKQHRLLYQLMVWPIALCVGLILYAAKEITFVGSFCWIKTDWVRWLTFYLPLYLILSFCTFSMIAIPYKLRKMKLLENNRSIVNTAAAYNAIFLVCWIPASVYRFVEDAWDTDESDITHEMPELLEDIFTLCLTTQGFWNCIVWMSSKVYKKEIQNLCNCSPLNFRSRTHSLSGDNPSALGTLLLDDNSSISRDRSNTADSYISQNSERHLSMDLMTAGHDNIKKNSTTMGSSTHRNVSSVTENFILNAMNTFKDVNQLGNTRNNDSPLASPLLTAMSMETQQKHTYDRQNSSSSITKNENPPMPNLFL